MECRPAPPLVPLLDVLFVLLLFLLLVADFGPRTQEPMLLPKAQCGNLCSMGAPPTVFTLNVHHRDDRTCPPHARGRRCEEEGHWTMSIGGIECRDARTLRRVIAREASAHANRTTFMNEQRVILRSDANAPCGLAQAAMDVCAGMGFHKVAVSTTHGF